MAESKRGSNQAFKKNQGRLRGNSSEAARIGALGGKKTKLRYENKKLLRDVLNELLEMPDDDTGVANAIEITRALIDAAKSHDVRAYEVIRDTLGQKPTENVSMQVELPEFVDDLSE